MANYSYNTLPPTSKEAVRVVGERYYRGFAEREKSIKGLSEGSRLLCANTGICVHLNHACEFLTQTYELQRWLKVFEAFEVLTDDIREELIPGFSKLPPENPYPSKCKNCGKAARYIGRLVLCSNDRCKSKKILRAKYK
jgi:hypothetical protein